MDNPRDELIEIMMQHGGYASTADVEASADALLAAYAEKLAQKIERDETRYCARSTQQYFADLVRGRIYPEGKI
jgi:hypothetical protein